MRLKRQTAALGLALAVGIALLGLGSIAHAQDRDHDRDDRSRAYQVGFDDGVHDGTRDRETHHSYRATEQSRYRHGDHGYSSSYGDKVHYQEVYREAYERGYRQGFGGHEEHDRDDHDRDRIDHDMDRR